MYIFTGTIPIQICWNHVADRKDGRFAEVIWLQDGNIGQNEQNNYSTVTNLHCNQMTQMQSMNNFVLSWFSLKHSHEYLDLCCLAKAEAFGRSIASQSCQLFYSMTKLLLWQSLRSQCWVLLLMNFILVFFVDRALTVGRMTWLSSPVKLKSWKRRLDMGGTTCGFFNLETRQARQRLARAVTCQLNTCCKFNAQVGNRFVCFPRDSCGDHGR